MVRTNNSHCEVISRTPSGCLKVAENPTKSVFGTDASVTFGEWATRLRTVAEVEEAVGKKGGETMTRYM